VEECQGSKVPIQAFADKVVKIFVPVLLIIASLTFASWMLFPLTFKTIILFFKGYLPWINPDIGSLSLAIFALIAVLVIACPCALGLATPTALMVGSGKGASKGILFRSGEAISALKDIKVIVFDKTGTITKGKPTLTDIHPLGGFTKNELIRFASSIEEKSEHPLASAILDYADKEGIKNEAVADFTSVTGRGVKGIIDSKKTLAGNADFLNESGVDTESASGISSKLESEGKSLIYLSIEGKLAGIIGIADEVKPDASHAIDKIHSLGMKTVMITGDNLKTAGAIAKKVGIDEVIANVLPDKKVEGVYSLQKKYGLVAMVGDGINDAPALTKADVGISIGTGTDIAIEASDVTIVRGNLIDVYNSIILSRATFKKIKQNLFWAFFYNLIAIPLAIAGLLHPAIAEAAMAASSINVVTNSLRIKKVKLIS
jgi:Cu+-exporting ATPase